MKRAETSSCSSLSHIVFIGRNGRGQWVAQEQSGLYGGLFVMRAEAEKVHGAAIRRACVVVFGVLLGGGGIAAIIALKTAIYLSRLPLLKRVSRRCELSFLMPGTRPGMTRDGGGALRSEAIVHA